MEKICPVCGKKFICSQTDDCWCSRITISEEVADYLRENYLDCLCEDCLKKIIETK